MTATGHALIATIIAAKFSNPLIALPLAFLSHIPCDVLPHWDAGTHMKKKSKKQIFYEAVIDVVISYIVPTLLFIYFFHQTNLLHLWSTIFAAQLLDWLFVPRVFFNNRHPFFKWVITVQKKFHNKLDKPWGIVTQIGAVVGLYIILFKLF